MAAISIATGRISRGSHYWTWLALTEADTADIVGDSLGPVTFADKSVQVDGTFGVGGSLSLEGSNDGSSFFILSDPLGNPLTFTTAGIKAVLENCRYIRPVLTAGTGVSLNIRLVGRGIMQLR